MKKIVLKSLLVFCVCSYAVTSNAITGIHIRSIDRPQDSVLPKEIVTQDKESLEHDKSMGYKFSTSDYPSSFFKLKEDAARETAIKNPKYGVYDTIIRLHYTDIKLSFKFNGIKSIPEKDILGYAAIGGYKDGWNSIKVFFQTNLGNWSYSRTFIQGAELLKEDTGYFINNKPSAQIIIGSFSTGFVYNITWYDNNYMNTLEYADKDLNKDIFAQMIPIAKNIDKDINEH